MTSEHADILNTLHEMQHSPVNALRRFALREAETLIVRQEDEIKSLKLKFELLAACNEKLQASNADLLAACEQALARIESDIESPNRKTGEGDALRAAIAKAKGESK